MPFKRQFLRCSVSPIHEYTHARLSANTRSKKVEFFPSSVGTSRRSRSESKNMGTRRDAINSETLPFLRHVHWDAKYRGGYNDNERWKKRLEFRALGGRGRGEAGWFRGRSGASCFDPRKSTIPRPSTAECGAINSGARNAWLACEWGRLYLPIRWNIGPSADSSGIPVERGNPPLPD